MSLLKGTIHVCESLAEVNGKLHLKSTKNGKDRTVSLPRFLCQMLSEHIGRHPSREGHVFSSANGSPCGGGTSTGGTSAQPSRARPSARRLRAGRTP